MSAHIRITNELAHIVSLIADKHEAASIAIDWRDGEPEMFWFVTADTGDTETVYVVDDESGTWAPLSDEEAARFSANQIVFEEVAATQEP